MLGGRKTLPSDPDLGDKRAREVFTNPRHTIEQHHGLIHERVGTVLHFLPSPCLYSLHSGIQLLYPSQ